MQERVGDPLEPYPSLIDGRCRSSRPDAIPRRSCSYGDFVDGCLTRLSTAALLNVTAGGGSTVPTFVVEPRDA